MKHLKLYEEYTTWNEILIDIINNLTKLGFKYKFGVYSNKNYEYSYKLDRSSFQIQVLNKDGIIVDNYDMNIFLDGLNKWGINMIKRNHKNIKQGFIPQQLEENKNYFTGSKADKKRMKSEIKKHSKKSDDDPTAYGKWEADYKKGDINSERRETKKSKATKKFNDMFESNSENSIKNKLKKVKDKYPKLTYSILKQVYDRGMAAWKTGHRPGTSQHQWAMGRVNSFLTGVGGSRKSDKDLWNKIKK